MASFAAAAVAQEPELLPPERAFSFSVRALDPAVVEARFAIASGYYLYRDKLKFGLESGPLASPPVLPPGKLKEDQFFLAGAASTEAPGPAPAAGRATVIFCSCGG